MGGNNAFIKRSTGETEVVPPGKLKCFITSKLRNDTPEERVRQDYVQKLHYEYGYPKELMEIEFPIQRGSKKGESVDIAIFYSNKKEQNNIQIIIETKAPTEKYPDYQVMSYVTATTAAWCAWTNGNETYYFKTNIGTKEVNKFTEIWDIPHYAQNLGALKKEQLIKPKNLTTIFKSLHDYIYANSNIKKPDRITTNIINVLFCKIYDELSFNKICKFYVVLNKNEEADVVKTYENILNIFNEVKSRYKEIFYASDAIEFDKYTVFEIVSKLQKFAFLNAEIDSIGTAFEVFTNESLKEDNGQFFTPRQVVKFMVDIISPQAEEYIIDPACGSGGFLVGSLRKISKDIDQSFKGRLTPDRINSHKRSIYSKYFFGIDQERDLVKISKAYMAIIGDGSANIYSKNSLIYPKKWENVSNELKLGNFDVILTNPPFGKDIKVRGKLLTQYDLAKKWSKVGDQYQLPVENVGFKSAVRPSILFLERCYQFLKKGSEKGRMGIILPVGDLSNDEDAYVKEWLLRNNKIFAIVQLPTETFQPYCGTQTCLVFLEPKEEYENDEYNVFMAQANKVGKDQRGKEIYKRDPRGTLILDSEGNVSLDNDLETIWNDYNDWLQGKNINSNLSFVVNSKSLTESLLPNYHNPTYSVLIKKTKRKQITYDKLFNLCHDVYTPPRTSRIYVDKIYGTAFLSGTNITQIIPQNVKYISNYETKKLSKYIVNEGDIVITRVGTMGIVRFIGKDLDKLAVSDNINIIKVDKSKIDPEYIFAILSSKIGQENVKKVSKGSVQNFNTPTDIKNLDIPILPDPEYSQIVESIKKSEEERINSLDRIVKAEDIINSFVE